MKSMFFYLYILFLFTKCAIASEHKNICVSGSYKQNELICNVFNIGGSCKTQTVQAKSGIVGGSMYLKNGFITEWLKVGGSLTASGLLHVLECNIGGSLHAKKAGKIEMQKATIGGSANAKYIFCTKNLNIVGSLNTNILQCTTFEVG